ncbi:putative bicyclomycin resistance protein [Hypoxylon trugodes]|uniref:putative bicyclomycin resistance protein n=1 Tax=Hypoxylon trugodes TaxID=326681 RepID=UPI00219091BB|nr:putative bicyclomycin resistance protein [Hypoxylon trugodes]KAI1385546.1 putative bicyclomycin resistance protein [Hypoxylon trugodes]
MPNQANAHEKLSMGLGKPIPPPLADPKDYIVEFDEDDPTHPYNWKTSTKLYTSILVCTGTFVAALASAIFAPGAKAASKEFGVSSEVGTLGTALFVLGFASGPLLWAPYSELQGRRWPLTIGMLAGGIFTVASAVAKDIQTLIICRFFAGVFAACQYTVVPGLLSDIYDNTYRGVANSVYALAVFGAPIMAPIIGGFINASSLGWRWTLYIPAILSFVNGGISLFFLRETYAPCILSAKAAVLRRQTGNWAIRARHELIELNMRHLFEKYFSRPVRMLITEPIILLVSLYMAFIYGLVYCLLGAYPYVFEEIYGISPGLSDLPFLGLLLGQVLAVAFVLTLHPSWVKKLANHDGKAPVPEWRLRPTLFGAPIFAIGLFWFGWTGFTPKIHWAFPTVAGIFIGFGNVAVFLPCFNYIVDAYLPLAASAVAANIMTRSAVAAGFPLFSRQMFQNMGVQWAGTLLGGLAAIMIPIPYLFRIYGPWLRGKSKILH